MSRVVADPIVRQMGTVVGSLCHNDPAGDWTAVALAARAVVVVRGKDGPRRVKIDEFLVDSYTTAAGEGEMALGVEFPVPDDQTAGSYQKVERKVGDFATTAAAVQISLTVDGTIREAGIALSAAGPCAVRVDDAERLLAGQKPSLELIRAASDAAWKRSVPQGDLRGSVEFKKHLAGVLVTRGLQQAFARLGPGRSGGAGHEDQGHGQRHDLRARGRAAHAARVFPARRLRTHRHPRRLRHVELRLLRRGRRRHPGGEVLLDVRGADGRPRGASPSKGSPRAASFTRSSRGSGINTACSAGSARPACC